MRGCWLVVLAVACPAGAARGPGADDRVLPCRPTIACTADLVAPGTAEVELGWAVRRLGAPETQHQTPFLLKLTLARWVQLQVLGGATLGEQRTFDDLVVGGKLHLGDQAARVPSLAVSGAVVVPTRREAIVDAASWGGQLAAFVSKDWGRLHVDLNAGLNLYRVAGVVRPQAWGALAFTVELPRGFGAMAEVYAFDDAAPNAPRDAGVLLAVSFAPLPWLCFDLGGDAGLVRTYRTFTLFAGLTIIPASLW